MNRPQTQPAKLGPLLAVLGLLVAMWFGLSPKASAVCLPQDHSDLFAANSSPGGHQETDALPPKNRIWENFGNSNEITLADELNSLQLRWESDFGELELASGVLSYADGNPISLSDPFGLAAAQNDFWGQVGDRLNALGESMFFASQDPQGATAAGTDRIISGVLGGGNTVLGSVQPLRNVGAYQSGSAADQGGDFMATYALTAGFGEGAKGAFSGGAAAEAGGMTTVSRWGRPGLQAGDFVMEGGATKMNYFNSGKWQPGFGNQKAPFGAGEEFVVPSSSLLKPSQASTATIFDKGPFGWIKDKMGQKTYSPK